MDGFIDKRIPIDDPLIHSKDTLGLHDGHWTPATIYERYFTLTTKLRRHTEEKPTTAAFWVTDYAQVFLKRFLEKKSELDL
ncbi:MAG: hypothetical protein GWN11_00060, partial [Candidatus Dadabacteria bacterium]|nr:hypothetical protein [Candidatus Dadabacteria bacterium]NIX14302.1 hypothetical protein [Candidatus Dadabacteria bacterium]